ncbi:MAG TPA: glycosyl hydrolase family 28-related protein [Candidatus Acidoferrales bacterium]|nr:glycosyl hydrolase family 28-related protein [Candidatus Acidoferrales bacterium]
MSNSRKVMARLLLTTVLALWAAVEFPAFATNLTGTFKSPDGSLVNGKLIFLLSQPARLNDSTAQIVPMVKIFSVSNGALESGAFIYGNDVLVPSGTYYLVRLVDNNNNLLFEQKWSIQGTNLDLGTLTPTTSGVVLADPLVKNTGTNQSVQGPVTFTSGLTALNLTLNGNLNPGTADSYDLGTTAAPWRQLIAKELVAKGPRPWYDVRAYGAVGNGSTDDTAAFQAAINACQANGGGGDVYVTPSPNFAYYRLLNTLTISTPPQNRNCRLLLANGLHTNKDIVIPPGWYIEGVLGGLNGSGAFMSDRHIRILGQTGTITEAVLKLNQASSASVKNVEIGWNGTSTAGAIYIKGGANIQLRNVFAGVTASDTTNTALRIEGPTQQVYIYNSVFSSGNQVTSKPAIDIYGVPGQTNAGNVFIYESVIINHGILNRAGGNGGFGGIMLVNVLHESVMSATLQVDSTGSSGRLWTIIGGTQADLAAATGQPLWEHIAGAYPVSDLTIIGAGQPIGVGYYRDTSGTAARITNVVILGGQENGIILRPPNSRMRAEMIPLMGWSSSILTATPSETLGTGLIGGQVNVAMQFPENVAVTGFTTGGTLAAGSYFYVVTALNGINAPFDGAIISAGTPYETWISQEAQCTVASGTTGRCDLTWNAVPGAVTYRIYGRGAYTTNNAQHNKTLFFTSTTTSVSDTGGAGTAGNPPRWDRESGNAPLIRLSGVGDNFIGGPKPLGVGSYAPQAKVHIASPDAATVGQRIDLAASPTANAWEVRDSAGTVQAKVDNGFNLTAPRLIASVATGTAPLGVSSTTEVNNLNTQFWHGKQAIDFSASLDFSSVAPQTCAELSVTVAGASVGSAVAPAWPASLENGLTGVMYVSAADNLRVRLCNVTSASIDPSNQTFAGRMIK